ncbi:hypothetical protein XELAEV_18011480mg, partial [Xenopus laevis]
MATNIEQIFRSFVVNKFKEIQEEKLNRDTCTVNMNEFCYNSATCGETSETSKNGELTAQMSGNPSEETIADVQDKEQMQPESTQLEQTQSLDLEEESAAKELKSGEVSSSDEVKKDASRKKSKKHKKHKSKKKKKKKKKEKSEKRSKSVSSVEDQESVSEHKAVWKPAFGTPPKEDSRVDDSKAGNTAKENIEIGVNSCGFVQEENLASDQITQTVEKDTYIDSEFFGPKCPNEIKGIISKKDSPLKEGVSKELFEGSTTHKSSENSKTLKQNEVTDTMDSTVNAHSKEKHILPSSNSGNELQLEQENIAVSQTKSVDLNNKKLDSIDSAPTASLPPNNTVLHCSEKNKLKCQSRSRSTSISKLRSEETCSSSKSVTKKDKSRSKPIVKAPPKNNIGSSSPGIGRRSRSSSLGRRQKSRSSSVGKRKYSHSNSPVQRRKSRSNTPCRSKSPIRKWWSKSITKRERTVSISPVRRRRSRTRSVAGRHRSRTRSAARKHRSRTRSVARRHRSKTRSVARRHNSGSRSTSSRRKSRSRSASRRRPRSQSGSRRRKSRSLSVSRRKRSQSRSVARRGKSRSRSLTRRRRSRSGSAARRRRRLRSASDSRRQRSRSGSTSRRPRSRSGSAGRRRRSRSNSAVRRRRSRSGSAGRRRRARSGSVRRRRSRSESAGRRRRSRSGSTRRRRRSRSGSAGRRRRSRSGSAARRRRSRSGSAARRRRSRSGSATRRRRSRSGSAARRQRTGSRSTARRRKSRSCSAKSRSGSKKRSTSRSVAKRNRSRSASLSRRRRARSESITKKQRSTSRSDSKRERSRSGSAAKRQQSRNASAAEKKKIESSTAAERSMSRSRSSSQRRRSQSAAGSRRSRSTSDARKRKSRSRSSKKSYEHSPDHKVDNLELKMKSSGSDDNSKVSKEQTESLNSIICLKNITDEQTVLGKSASLTECSDKDPLSWAEIATEPLKHSTDSDHQIINSDLFDSSATRRPDPPSESICDANDESNQMEVAMELDSCHSDSDKFSTTEEECVLSDVFNKVPDDFCSLKTFEPYTTSDIVTQCFSEQEPNASQSKVTVFNSYLSVDESVNLCPKSEDKPFDLETTNKQQCTTTSFTVEELTQYNTMPNALPEFLQTPESRTCSETKINNSRATDMPDSAVSDRPENMNLHLFKDQTSVGSLQINQSKTVSGTDVCLLGDKKSPVVIPAPENSAEVVAIQSVSDTLFTDHSHPGISAQTRLNANALSKEKLYDQKEDSFYDLEFSNRNAAVMQNSPKSFQTDVSSEQHFQEGTLCSAVDVCTSGMDQNFETETLSKKQLMESSKTSKLSKDQKLTVDNEDIQSVKKLILQHTPNLESAKNITHSIDKFPTVEKPICKGSLSSYHLVENLSTVNTAQRGFQLHGSIHIKPDRSKAQTKPLSHGFPEMFEQSKNTHDLEIIKSNAADCTDLQDTTQSGRFKDSRTDFELTVLSELPSAVSKGHPLQINSELKGKEDSVQNIGEYKNEMKSPIRQVNIVNPNINSLPSYLPSMETELASSKEKNVCPEIRKPETDILVNPLVPDVVQQFPQNQDDGFCFLTKVEHNSIKNIIYEHSSAESRTVKQKLVQEGTKKHSYIASGEELPISESAKEISTVTPEKFSECSQLKPCRVDNFIEPTDEQTTTATIDKQDFSNVESVKEHLSDKSSSTGTHNVKESYSNTISLDSSTPTSDFKNSVSAVTDITRGSSQNTLKTGLPDVCSYSWQSNSKQKCSDDQKILESNLTRVSRSGANSNHLEINSSKSNQSNKYEDPASNSEVTHSQSNSQAPTGQVQSDEIIAQRYISSVPLNFKFSRTFKPLSISALHDNAHTSNSIVSQNSKQNLLTDSETLLSSKSSTLEPSKTIILPPESNALSVPEPAESCDLSLHHQPESSGQSVSVSCTEVEPCQMDAIADPSFSTVKPAFPHLSNPLTKGVKQRQYRSRSMAQDSRSPSVDHNKSPSKSGSRKRRSHSKSRKRRSRSKSLKGKHSSSSQGRKRRSRSKTRKRQSPSKPSSKRRRSRSKSVRQQSRSQSRDKSRRSRSKSTGRRKQLSSKSPTRKKRSHSRSDTRRRRSRKTSRSKSPVWRNRSHSKSVSKSPSKSASQRRHSKSKLPKSYSYSSSRSASPVKHSRRRNSSSKSPTTRRSSRSRSRGRWGNSRSSRRGRSSRSASRRNRSRSGSQRSRSLSDKNHRGSRSPIHKRHSRSQTKLDKSPLRKPPSKSTSPPPPKKTTQLKSTAFKHSIGLKSLIQKQLSQAKLQSSNSKLSSKEQLPAASLATTTPLPASSLPAKTQVLVPNIQSKTRLPETNMNAKVWPPLSNQPQKTQLPLPSKDTRTLLPVLNTNARAQQHITDLATETQWPVADLTTGAQWPMPDMATGGHWALSDMTAAGHWTMPDMTSAGQWAMPDMSSGSQWPLSDMTSSPHWPLSDMSTATQWPVSDLSSGTQWPASNLSSGAHWPVSDLATGAQWHMPDLGVGTQWHMPDLTAGMSMPELTASTAMPDLAPTIQMPDLPPAPLPGLAPPPAPLPDLAPPPASLPDLAPPPAPLPDLAPSLSPLLDLAPPPAPLPDLAPATLPDLAPPALLPDLAPSAPLPDMNPHLSPLPDVAPLPVPLPYFAPPAPLLDFAPTPMPDLAPPPPMMPDLASPPPLMLDLAPPPPLMPDLAPPPPLMPDLAPPPAPPVPINHLTSLAKMPGLPISPAPVPHLASAAQMPDLAPAPTPSLISDLSLSSGQMPDLAPEVTPAPLPDLAPSHLLAQPFFLPLNESVDDNQNAYLSEDTTKCANKAVDSNQFVFSDKLVKPGLSIAAKYPEINEKLLQDQPSEHCEAVPVAAETSAGCDLLKESYDKSIHPLPDIALVLPNNTKPTVLSTSPYKPVSTELSASTNDYPLVQLSDKPSLLLLHKSFDEPCHPQRKECPASIADCLRGSSSGSLEYSLQRKHEEHSSHIQLNEYGRLTPLNEPCVSLQHSQIIEPCESSSPILSEGASHSSSLPEDSCFVPNQPLQDGNIVFSERPLQHQSCISLFPPEKDKPCLSPDQHLEISVRPHFLQQSNTTPNRLQLPATAMIQATYHEQSLLHRVENSDQLEDAKLYESSDKPSASPSLYSDNANEELKVADPLGRHVRHTSEEQSTTQPLPDELFIKNDDPLSDKCYVCPSVPSIGDGSINMENFDLDIKPENPDQPLQNKYCDRSKRQLIELANSVPSLQTSYINTDQFATVEQYGFSDKRQPNEDIVNTDPVIDKSILSLQEPVPPQPCEILKDALSPKLSAISDQHLNLGPSETCMTSKQHFDLCKSPNQLQTHEPCIVIDHSFVRAEQPMLSDDAWKNPEQCPPIEPCLPAADWERPLPALCSETWPTAKYIQLSKPTVHDEPGDGFSQALPQASQVQSMLVQACASPLPPISDKPSATTVQPLSEKSNSSLCQNVSDDRCTNLHQSVAAELSDSEPSHDLVQPYGKSDQVILPSTGVIPRVQKPLINHEHILSEGAHLQLASVELLPSIPISDQSQYLKPDASPIQSDPCSSPDITPEYSLSATETLLRRPCASSPSMFQEEHSESSDHLTENEQYTSPQYTLVDKNYGSPLTPESVQISETPLMGNELSLSSSQPQQVDQSVNPNLTDYSNETPLLVKIIPKPCQSVKPEASESQEASTPILTVSKNSVLCIDANMHLEPQTISVDPISSLPFDTTFPLVEKSVTDKMEYIKSFEKKDNTKQHATEELILHSKAMPSVEQYTDRGEPVTTLGKSEESFHVENCFRITPPDLFPYDSEQPAVPHDPSALEQTACNCQPPPELLPYDSEQPANSYLGSSETQSEQASLVFHAPPELLPYDSDQPTVLHTNSNEIPSINLPASLSQAELTSQKSSVPDSLHLHESVPVNFQSEEEQQSTQELQTTQVLLESGSIANLSESPMDIAHEQLECVNAASYQSDVSYTPIYMTLHSKECNLTTQISSENIKSINESSEKHFSSELPIVSPEFTNEEHIDFNQMQSNYVKPVETSESVGEDACITELPTELPIAGKPHVTELASKLSAASKALEHRLSLSEFATNAELSASLTGQQPLLTELSLSTESQVSEISMAGESVTTFEQSNIPALKESSVLLPDATCKRPRSKSINRTNSRSQSISRLRDSRSKSVTRMKHSRSKSRTRKRSRSKSATSGKRSRSKSVAKRQRSHSKSALQSKRSRSKSATRRSRSKSYMQRRHSRSKSTTRKKRSRSKSNTGKRRSLSRSAGRKRRSRSRSVGRKRRSRSKSPVRKRRSRSQSTARKRRSRSKSAGRKKRSRSKSNGRKRRSRSTSAARRRRSRSVTMAHRRRSSSASAAHRRRSRSTSVVRRRRSRSSSVARRRRSRSVSAGPKRTSRSLSVSKRRRSWSKSVLRRRRSRSPSGSRRRRSRSASVGRRRRSRSTSVTRKGRSRSVSVAHRRRSRSTSEACKKRSRSVSATRKRRSASISLTPKSPTYKSSAVSRSDRSRSHSQSNILRKRKTRSRSSSRDKNKLSEKRRRRSNSKDHYNIKSRRRSRTPPRRKKSRSPIKRMSPVRRRRSRSTIRRKSFSRSPVRRKRSRSRDKSLDSSRSPKRLTDLDKAQLLEIAKANAAAMCAKAGMPLPSSLKPVITPATPSEDKNTVRAYGNTIQELTEKCKQIAQSKEDDVIVNKPHDSDEEEEERPFYNHPFKVSDHKPISFSLLNPSVKPTPKNQVTLTKEFPVSSGSQNTKKESEKVYGEWVPVDKKSEESKDDVFTNTAPSQ